MNRPFFHVLLFLASMIIAGSLLLGLSGCSKQEQAKPTKQSAKVATQPTPAPPVVPLPISVDFDNMALSSVAQFVTAQTGKGFILSGLEAKPITWIESNMAKDKIFDSSSAPRSIRKPPSPILCNTKAGTTSPWCRRQQRTSSPPPNNQRNPRCKNPAGPRRSERRAALVCRSA